jgi:acetylornithine deacetylase
MSRVAEILASLVSIASVNPRDSESDGGETRVAEFIAGWARQHGWEAELEESQPSRSNVYVTVPGSLYGRVLLQSHTDTVEVEGMTVEPFHLRREGDKLIGRGTCDAKGQLAMFMAAVELVAQSGEPHHEVILAGCVDEEERYRGVLTLCERHRQFAGAVVGEPTELRMVVAHKGVVRGRIRVEGPGGHSSTPRGRINPISVCAQIVDYLDCVITPRLGPDDPLLGPPTLVVTMIEGGEGVNIIPREASLRLDRRTLGCEDPIGVWRALQNEIESRWPEAVVEEPSLIDYGLDAADGSAMVEAMGSALAGAGLDPAGVGAPYGTDASKIARMGVPCVVFGAGSIRNAHTPDEFVSITQLERGVEVIRALVCSESVDGTGL